MLAHCKECRVIYNDAYYSTICPHERFMTDEQFARKDAAIALMAAAHGKRVVFNHMPEAEGYRLISIGWDGMVTIEGMAGEFAPHLFKVKEG